MRWLTVVAFAALVVAAGVFGQSAAAAVSKRALPHPAILVAKMRGTIGSAPPSANAKALVRAAGLDDGSGGESELGSDDAGAAGLGGGKVAHGSIGSCPPERRRSNPDPRPRSGRLMTAGAAPFPAPSRAEVTPSHAARRRWVGLALWVVLAGNAVGILLIWGGGGADGLGYHWHSLTAR